MFQPGFELVLRPVRSYPYHAAANILGYIGEVPPFMLQDSMQRWADYNMGDFIGRTGLEASYEKVLMGQRGIQYLVKDNLNRPQGPLENGEFDTAAVAGKNLRLALDIELQALGEKFLKNKIGSIVAIDPQTGGVLAMVSGPTFDPNLLTGSMGVKLQQAICRYGIPNAEPRYAGNLSTRFLHEATHRADGAGRGGDHEGLRISLSWRLC
ncbi:penicillin-binding transpeptidase domain-containing protein [Chitinophaga sedimenti]|uniref:penicillin-binding transpeptidase domain-containing protein n=1 Tax=Chitinophaga sedimenti TaxID=2033606 RepID=UPI00249EEF93|nr:penicillin-binding transpeptidase domain-containing protein [Chitinophaga sedimenti]